MVSSCRTVTTFGVMRSRTRRSFMGVSPRGLNLKSQHPSCRWTFHEATSGRVGSARGRVGEEPTRRGGGGQQAVLGPLTAAQILFLEGAGAGVPAQGAQGVEDHRHVDRL